MSKEFKQVKGSSLCQMYKELQFLEEGKANAICVKNVSFILNLWAKYISALTSLIESDCGQ